MAWQACIFPQIVIFLNGSSFCSWLGLVASCSCTSRACCSLGYSYRWLPPTHITHKCSPLKLLSPMRWFFFFVCLIWRHTSCKCQSYRGFAALACHNDPIQAKNFLVSFVVRRCTFLMNLGFVITFLIQSFVDLLSLRPAVFNTFLYSTIDNITLFGQGQSLCAANFKGSLVFRSSSSFIKCGLIGYFPHVNGGQDTCCTEL